MAPIRVGIIGLSPTAKTAWASTAHLPYLKASKHKYAIAALCNSSVASAKSAIEVYGLPQSTRAYGNPQDLANDEEVRFVIQNLSSVRGYM
jgi:predicted dehydrogenase